MSKSMYCVRLGGVGNIMKVADLNISGCVYGIPKIIYIYHRNVLNINANMFRATRRYDCSQRHRSRQFRLRGCSVIEYVELQVQSTTTFSILMSMYCVKLGGVTSALKVVILKSSCYVYVVSKKTYID